MKRWDRPFDDPIPGIATLRDAAEFIQRLPKSEHDLPHWQAATAALIMAAEDKGPMLHARVGMLTAMQHGKPGPEKEPRRKRVRTFKIIRR